MFYISSSIKNNIKNKGFTHAPKDGAGFTLIEVIVAIFILITGVVGIYIAFSRVILVLPIISSRLTAAYLSQEGIEIIRNIRDTNWLKGISWSNGLLCGFPVCDWEADYDDRELTPYTGSPLNLVDLDDDGFDDFYAYFSGTPTSYKRKITVEKIEDDILKISVQVQWEVKGKPYDFTAEEYLYNWK